MHLHKVVFLPIREKIFTFQQMSLCKVHFFCLGWFRIMSHLDIQYQPARGFWEGPGELAVTCSHVCLIRYGLIEFHADYWFVALSFWQLWRWLLCMVSLTLSSTICFWVLLQSLCMFISCISNWSWESRSTGCYNIFLTSQSTWILCMNITEYYTWI